MGIEHALWKNLLDVATGRSNAFTALQNFVANIPWDELDMLDDDAADFFTSELSFQ